MSGNRHELAPRGDEKEDQSAENIRLEEELKEIQMANLSTERRDDITSCDSDAVMARRVDHRSLDRNREYNQPGSAAYDAARKHSHEIKSWNMPLTETEDDDTEEEKLQDIGGGQIHREALAKSLAEHGGSGGGGHKSDSHRGTRSTRGGRGRRGRGGGIVGTRGRGDGRTIRVPKNPSSPLAVADPTPATFGPQDLHHASQESAAGNSSRGKESGYKALRPTSALDAKPAAVPGHSHSKIVKQTAQAAKPAPRLVLRHLPSTPIPLATPEQFLASTGRFGSPSTQAVLPQSVGEASGSSKAKAVEKAKSKELVSRGDVVNLPRVTSSRSAESRLKEKEINQIKADEKLATQLQTEWNAQDNETLESTGRVVAKKTQKAFKDNFNKQSRDCPPRDNTSVRQPQAQIFTDFTDYGPPRVLVRKKSSDPDLISYYGSPSTSVGSEASSDGPSGTVPFNQSPNIVDLEGLVFPSDGAANTVPAGAPPVAIALQSTTSLPQQKEEYVPTWRDTIPATVRNDPGVVAAYEALLAAVSAIYAPVPVVEAGNTNEITPLPVTHEIIESAVTEPHSATAASATLPEEMPATLTMPESQHTPVEDFVVPSGGRTTIVRSDNPIVGGHVLPGRLGTLNQRASFDTGNVANRVSSGTTTRGNGGQRNVSGGRVHQPYPSNVSGYRGIRSEPAGVPKEHQTSGGTVVMPDRTWVESTGRRHLLDAAEDRAEYPNLNLAPPIPAPSDGVDLQQLTEGIKKVNLADKTKENQQQAKNPFAGPSQSATLRAAKVENWEIQSSSAPKQNPFATPAVAQAVSPQSLAVPSKKRVRFPDNVITRQYARGDPNTEEPPVKKPDVKEPEVVGSSSLASVGGNSVGREDTGNRQTSIVSLSSGTAGYPSNDPGAAARAQYGGGSSTSNVAPQTSALTSSSSSIPPQSRSSTTNTPTLPAADTPATRPRPALLTNMTGPILGEHLYRSAKNHGNINRRGN